MRKTSILLLFYFILFSTAFGQQQEKITYGPRMGLNFSFFNQNLHYDNEWKNYGRISPFIGAFVRSKISRNFSIQTEILYTLKGGSSRIASNSVFTQTNQGFEKAYYYKNYRLNYIEIPLLLHCDITPAKSGTHYFIQAGIAPSFAITSSLRSNEYSMGSGTGLGRAEEKWKVERFHDARTFNTSLIAGMHFGPFGNTKAPFAFDIRYTKSLLDTYRKNDFYPFYNAKLTIQTLCLAFSKEF